MNFDIEELKINFFTNIRRPEYRIVEFKRGLLYHPELNSTDALLNEYPYFTFDIKYPLNKLLNLSYTDRVEFFFDKDKFSQGLIAYANESDILVKRDDTFGNSVAEEEYYKQRTINIEHNIMTMIELLFPTRFPVINDLYTSFDAVMGKAALKPLSLNPILPKYFSYLKLGGTYTFKKLIWINDVLNHPVYQKLIVQYMKYTQWHNEEKYKLMKIIQTNYAFIGAALPNILEEIYNKRAIAVFGLNRQKVGNIILLLLLTGTTRNEIEEKINNSADITKVDKEYYIFVMDEFLEVNLDIFSPDLEFTLNRYEKVSDLLDELKEQLPIYKVFALFRSLEVDKFLKSFRMYSFVESLHRKTFDEINRESAEKRLPIPSPYRQFSYATLSQYRKPVRESTNAELQELIEGVENDKVVDFYLFMEYIYRKYVFSGAKSPPKSDDRFNALMNVGLSYINVGASEGVRREIYVYADFIQGQVDETNVKKIFCPYVGDHLGNEFEFLTRLFFNKKTANKYMKTWNINQNRTIFTIEENKEVGNVTGINSQYVLDSKPMDQIPVQQAAPQMAAPPYLIAPQSNNQNEPKENTDRLSAYFVSEIISKNKDELTKRMQRISEMNPGEVVNDQTILSFIKRNESNLYNIILEWNQEIDKKNQKLLGNMIKLGSLYDGEIKSREYAQKNNVLINRDPEKMKLLMYEIRKYELLAAVLKGLSANEENKKMVGGKMHSRSLKKRFLKKRLIKKGLKTRKNVSIYTLEDLKPRLRGSVFKGNVTDK